MPDEFPQRPSHEQVLHYFELYCDKHQISELVDFDSEVKKTEREGDKWKVIVKEGEEKPLREYTCKYLSVCNGHHRRQIMPKESQVKGLKNFRGEIIHSGSYRVAEKFREKRVLIAGLGISGSDIFDDLKSVAKAVFISSRRIPLSIEKECLKPTFEVSKDGSLSFSDGTTLEIDAIIFCWGYSYHFPFFEDIKDEELKRQLKVEENPSRVSLYKHVFVPGVDNLAFIGLPSVDGSLHPICDKQAEWFSCVASGECALPPREEMEKEIEIWKENKRPYRPMQIASQSYLKAIDELIEKHRKKKLNCLNKNLDLYK